MIKHLAKGQAARIVLHGHGEWTARVEASLPDRLALTTLTVLPRDTAGAGGEVAVSTALGVLRAPCVVLGTDRSGLVELSIAGEHHVDQRRSHVRVAARVPGVVATPGHMLRPLHTYTLDVSGGGVLVAGAGPVDIGTPVAVTVKLPDRDPLRSRGRVTRRTDEGHVALAFDGMDADEREQLVRWIFERQRLELREARGNR
jgi:hypothetical protein